MANQSRTFETFCGGKFWDSNLTWYTATPRLTPCFQDSLLIWIPCAWLWIALLPYALYIRSQPIDPSRVGKLHTARLLFCYLLIISSLVNLCSSLMSSASPTVLYVSYSLQAATYLLVLVLLRHERRRGFVTSGVLFILWSLSLIAGTLIFASQIQLAKDKNIENKLRFGVFCGHYFFVIVQFLLTFLPSPRPDRPYTSKRPCPEINASFPSRISFWWMNDLILTGYKKDLQESDLWQLNPRDVSRNVSPIFDKAWQAEIERTRWSNGKSSGLNEQGEFPSGGYQEAEKAPLLQEKANYSSISTVRQKKKIANEPSLLKVLGKCYLPTLVIAHLCKLVCDILTFVGPQIQKLLIQFTQDESEEMWKGYLYASMFLGSSILNSFFFHQLFHIGMTLGMRIKSAVIAAVYKKALTMSNEARRNTTVGEIVNLMSVDAQRLQDVTGYLWMTWSSPFQIVIAVYMLWQIVGISTLAGLAVMILLIPVNGVIANYSRKIQISQMKIKDNRIKLMNEVLNGMKVLKLYAWELSFQEKVDAIRNLELETLRQYSYLSCVGSFTWTCAPFIVTLATFFTFVLTGNRLDAQTAFVALSLFNILRFPINLLPMMISYIITASVSIKRLGAFLRTGDLDRDNVSHNPTSDYPIEIKKGNFTWGLETDDVVVLNNIDLQVEDGKLYAIVGHVGSGKSSLISAILGEMEKLSGLVNVRGEVAYVAQQAWIQNASLRDNILFGKDFNQKKYDQVIEACALKPDLEILPGGDQTEIGEKGINLSGGQKQRVSLARAVYNEADIYLLDDPLSAVDSHVGKHIFEQVISDAGMLRGKTRVLVTHGIHWLPKVDYVVVIEGGFITESGTYEELVNNEADFASFLKTYLTQTLDEADDEDPEIIEAKRRILARVDSIQTHSDTGKASESESGLTDSVRLRRPSRQLSSKSRVVSGSKGDKVMEEKEPDHSKEKLIQDEVSEVGGVKWKVFYAYLAALGMVNSVCIIAFFLIFQASSVASNVWLSQWTEDKTLNSNLSTNDPRYIAQRDMYLGVYGGLGVAQALAVLVYAIITAISMVKASKILHYGMLSNIMRAPMSFFDTTPIGRILNRFSRDIETIDNILPNLIRSWMNTLFTVLSTIVVISYSTPNFLIVVIPLGILYFFVQRFYIPSSRQLKRLESTTRSPIYVNFSETITGSATIRAFAHQSRFLEKSASLVDHNLIFYFSSIASNRWLGFRLEFVGASIVFMAALFAVLGRDQHLQGGFVGLSISYALQITSSLNWMVRMTSDLETNIISVERVEEYSNTPSEAEWTIEETRPPSRWPHEGKVSLQDYSTRYRDELDLVLRGVNVDIKGGEKVGIVGRTGAGKSSFTLSLFRLIEAASGSITIDGIPLSILGLHQLRSKLTILPQDPVLFSGTLRMNLDPFDMYSDNQIWEALKHAHLKDFVAGIPSKLDYECGEGGQNLSVGQRQLVCLARTLLRKTKVLILDEATAAVDLETDELIQQTIKKQFQSATVITIAHRINTIMDSDQVLVLDQGQVAEYDSPGRLLKNKSSRFFGMAKDAGLVS